MRLHVCPLHELESVLSTSGAQHVISLMGPEKAIERPVGISGGFLALEFNDIGEPRDGLIAPTPAHMRAILDAVREWQALGAHEIVFQCWMGVSRSTAACMAAALALSTRAEPEIWAQRLRREAPFATPNPLMIAHADTALGLNGTLKAAIAAIGRGADAPHGSPFKLEIDR